MDEERPRKKLRTGTKSCIECRRRKVRCTWQSVHNFTCDGCLARGLSCRLQGFAHDYGNCDNELTAMPRRNSLSRLEKRLGELVDRVCFLERGSAQDSLTKHVGGGPHHMASVVTTIPASPNDTSDLPGGNLAHIRSLFERAFVESEGSSSRKASTTPPPSRGLSDDREALRVELLQLRPCDKDFELVLHYAPDWWELIDTGIPPLSIGSKNELRAVLERLRNPDSDPALIALWLVTTAITVQQVPPDANRIVFENSAILRAFPENIMARIERVLATHQNVAASVWGVECSLMLVKLQLNCGRVRRAWLTLRAGIACAELLGLPDLCRSPDTLSRLVQTDGLADVTDPSSPVLKASIWIQLCLVERIIGVLLNLPSTTCARPSQLPQYLLRHNRAGRELFWALSKIAVKIRDRDDSIAFAATSTDWIAETESIERELQDLADSAGIREKELDIGEGKKPSEHSGALPIPLLYQHMYFYLLLRTHLPLMIQAIHTKAPARQQTATHPASSATARNGDDEANSSTSRSHALCLYACSRMGRIYLQQISGPARGLFPMRISDFMAFTAIAVLILEQEGVFHIATPAGSSAMAVRGDTSGNARLLEELVAMLKQAAKQEGRVIAVQAVKAVDAIRATLASPGDSPSPGTSIRVPLLGIMRVMRRTRSVLPPDVCESRKCKRTATESISGANIDQRVDKQQYQGTRIQFQSCAFAGNTGNLTSCSTNSSASVTGRYNPKSTPLQQPFSPGIAAWLSSSPVSQSRIGGLPTARLPISMAEPSHLSGAQYDWVAETIKAYNMDATGAQDAQWLWDDNVFGAF